MKKKLISLLLTVLMIASMASAIGVTAYAEPTVTIVQVAQGDTVISICKKYGFDYYTYKNLVMALNNVSDESQFSNIKVGENFCVPVSEAAAKTLASATSTITITAGASTGTTNASKTPGEAKQIPTGDKVSFYVVEHTMEKGETITGIYADWGIGYKTYTNMILNLNNISSFNKINAGKKMLLPTTSAASGDSVVYTVMAHSMKSGETVYNVITTGYGMDFNTNEELLKSFNNKDNLAAFKVGETLSIPISGTVSVTA